MTKKGRRKSNRTAWIVGGIAAVAAIVGIGYAASKLGTPKVSAKTTGQGSVTCDGLIDPTVNVNVGSSLVLQISANSGYFWSTITIDGQVNSALSPNAGAVTLSDGTTASLTGGQATATLTLGNIQGSHSIVVSFQQLQVSITYEYTTGGLVTALG